MYCKKYRTCSPALLGMYFTANGNVLQGLLQIQWKGYCKYTERLSANKVERVLQIYWKAYCKYSARLIANILKALLQIYCKGYCKYIGRLIAKVWRALLKVGIFHAAALGAEHSIPAHCLLPTTYLGIEH